MADIAIFRINYKSDFILTLQSDAGWMTPFCIKFWTGAPSQAYFAGYDGTTYTHCAPVDGDPTKLSVQFDDHHLPIGDMKFQIGYHFTVADFPTSIEDEVINQAAVIIDNDGEQQQVMLDFNGETAPEIAFAMPAYANEAQRIANEQARIAAEEQRVSNEQQRISNEEGRISAEESRQENEQQRIHNEETRIAEFASLKAEAIAATGAANDAATFANEKAQLAADKAALAQTAATLANDKAQLAADKASLAQAAATLANDKAALAQQKADYAQAKAEYAQAQGDYAKAQSDIALADHERAETDHERAEADHDTATDDHTTATSDHTQAESDHTRAEADHTTAASDHTQASSDHSTATTDHTQAGQDHTRAESDHTTAAADHTRAESDHAAVEAYVDSLGAFDISAYHATGSVLAKYADLTAALGTNGANIPDELRKGGMSVKFVLSSDNKYVQYRLMATAWSNVVGNWQGVTDEIKFGSIDLVESGAVASALANKVNKDSLANDLISGASLSVCAEDNSTFKVKRTAEDAKDGKYFIQGIYGNHAIVDGNYQSVSDFSLKFTGRNLWDGGFADENTILNADNTTESSENYDTTDYIQIIGGETYYIKHVGDTPVCFYSEDKSFISAATTNEFIAPATAAYVRFSVEKTDTQCCLNFSDSQFNGTYEAYSEEVNDVDITSIQGVNKTTGNTEIIFPYGLCHGKTFADSIVGNVATKVFFKKHLYDLTWRYSTANGGIFLAALTPKPVASNNGYGYISSLYGLVTLYQFRTSQKDMSFIFTDTDIQIRNKSFNGDVSAFKESLNGVYVLYAVATPVLYTVENDIIPVNGLANGIESIDLPIPVNISLLYKQNIKANAEFASGEKVCNITIDKSVSGVSTGVPTSSAVKKRVEATDAFFLGDNLFDEYITEATDSPKTNIEVVENGVRFSTASAVAGNFGYIKLPELKDGVNYKIEFDYSFPSGQYVMPFAVCNANKSKVYDISPNIPIADNSKYSFVLPGVSSYTYLRFSMVATNKGYIEIRNLSVVNTNSLASLNERIDDITDVASFKVRTKEQVERARTLGFKVNNSAHLPEGYVKQLVFMHISDTHGDNTTQGKATLKNALECASLISGGSQLSGNNCKFILHTGDFKRGNTFDADFTHVADVLADNTFPFYMCIGNHDVGNTWHYSEAGTDEQVYQQMVAPYINGWNLKTDGEGTPHPEGKSYYFTDFTTEKIRLIVLYEYENNLNIHSGDTLSYHRAYRCFRQAQINWLIDSLQTTPKGYGVIIAKHQIEDATGDLDIAFNSVLSRGTENGSSYVGKSIIADIVDAFIDKTSINTQYTISPAAGESELVVSADFSGIAEGTEFICYCSGHSHRDRISYLKNYPKQLELNITCDNAYYTSGDDMIREYNVLSEDAINVYSIDRNRGYVYIVRVGAHLSYTMQDRKMCAINYRNGRM